MTLGGYRLGVDFGTSSTVAMLAGPDGRARPLLFDASPLLSSGVYAGPGTGPLLTGTDAERAASAHPAGFEANPKRRIDDHVIWLAEREVTVTDAIAAVLTRISVEARRVAGRPPDAVVLTHPAGWSHTRLGILAASADRAQLGDCSFVAEPVAAAAYFAHVLGRDLPVGRCLVVYDLGAGTCDVSIVRRTAGGLEVVATAGLDDVGGLDLDAAIVTHARSLTTAAGDAWGRLEWPRTPTDQRAHQQLWRDARTAKEQLSRHTTADLHIPLVDTVVHVTRDEFETAARPHLDRTVDLTATLLRDTGLPRQHIAGIFLVGGSSRVPLTASLLHRTLRIAPTALDHPELVVAEGALHTPTTTSTHPPTKPTPPAAAAPTPTEPVPTPATPTPTNPAPPADTSTTAGADAHHIDQPTAIDTTPGDATAERGSLDATPVRWPRWPPRTRRDRATIGGTVALVLAIIATTGLWRFLPTGPDSSGDQPRGTFIFAGAAEPDDFDPIFNFNEESLRPIRQMYETLVTHKPGTAELTGGLAESWEHDADGKVWTFKLRKGVKFHDGTPFNAAAVCFNFERWYNMKSPSAQDRMFHYKDVFDGFAKNEVTDVGDPVYKSCAAKDDATAVLILNRYRGAFPGAFALPAFSIASPAALKKYAADPVEDDDRLSYRPSQFATANPVGTGPFAFGGWDKAKNEITLNRNPDYWGDKAKVEKVIIRVIEDESTREQELRAGTVHGIDFPAMADREALAIEGFQVLNRPAFNILYLGINQRNNPKLQDLRVRQAIAYALDREQMVRTLAPAGSTVASQFMPDTVLGHAPDAQKYEYDPDRAKQLLKEAGAEGLTLNFYYPTDVSRGYMPNPRESFTALANDLRAVGVKVNGVPRPWHYFLQDVRESGKQDLHLLGWIGEYSDPGHFVGTFFGRDSAEFGDQAMTDMFGAITKADGTVDEAAKKTAWEQVNRDIASKWLPAVPIWHAPQAIVVTKDVTGLVVSPLRDERFNTLSVTAK
ncbi:ABC transporter substrate-binding protein [Plantactinospora sp. CA-294935]|uniref:ABC transporter substrate-binding protein n=1 Tax=Plantactinospora sp. CA-294935 TaxID=3240012 RepID=UPI003D94D91D